MRAAVLITVTSVALLGVAISQNIIYQQDPNWRVPGNASARSNPLAQRPEAAAGGEKLFKRNCVECHGEDGSGLTKKHAADLQIPVVQQQTDGTLFWKITNGNTDRGMPSFSRLHEMQRWQLVLYLRTLRPAGGPQSKGAEK
jgi:mono/diheme cytochrome c family protein